MAQSTLESRQIAVLVSRDINSIKGLESSLASDDGRHSKAASQLARLKLWAGSLGAHRESGHRSLGYRLRDASSIRKYVIVLLEQLGKAAEDALQTSNDSEVPRHETHGAVEPELMDLLIGDDESPQTDVDRALADISHVIDCLLRLSVTIRNPAPHDQFESRVGSETIVAYEPYDIKHVTEKFPLVEGNLAKRLGKAITSRRHFFKYREDHYSRLVGCNLDDDGGLAEGGDQTTVASPVPGHLKDTAEQDLVLMEIETQSAISRTSYAPSLNNSQELRVPPVPKGYLLGPFLCPFCYLMIEVNSRNDWKKHVFRDLQPYTCLAQYCLIQDHKFSRRADWSRHMEEVHWRVWGCPYRCQQAFHTADEFRHHIQKAHSNEIPLQQQEAFERMCSQADLSKLSGPCPLCFEVHITTGRQYFTHVGYHLEQLSLFALPQTTNDEDESMSQNDEMENEKFHKESRSQNSGSPVSEPNDDMPLAEDGQESNAIEHASTVRESVKRNNNFAEDNSSINTSITSIDRDMALNRLNSAFTSSLSLDDLVSMPRDSPTNNLHDHSVHTDSIENDSTSGPSMDPPKSYRNNLELNDAHKWGRGDRRLRNEGSKAAAPAVTGPDDIRADSVSSIHATEPASQQYFGELQRVPESRDQTDNGSGVAQPSTLSLPIEQSKLPDQQTPQGGHAAPKYTSAARSPQPDPSKWRWTCCNCTWTNLSYVFDPSCLNCGHYRQTCCEVWASA